MVSGEKNQLIRKEIVPSSDFPETGMRLKGGMEWGADNARGKKSVPVLKEWICWFIPVIRNLLNTLLSQKASVLSFRIWFNTQEETRKQNVLEWYKSACIRCFSTHREGEREEACPCNEAFPGQGQLESCFSWWAAELSGARSQNAKANGNSKQKASRKWVGIEQQMPCPKSEVARWDWEEP